MILATGGGARIFGRTDNPAGTTGDGYALAYRAGAELVDMELMELMIPNSDIEKIFLNAQSLQRRIGQDFVSWRVPLFPGWS